MVPEKVEDYETKADEQRRSKAALLSMRARDCASAVRQFGDAVVAGARLISAGDVNMMVAKLNYYADWLQRIADGEAVEEEHLKEMERVIASIRLPKKNKYKRGIIEVIYVGETDRGAATRHKLYEMDYSEPYQGDSVTLKFNIGGKWGNRLKKKA